MIATIHALILPLSPQNHTQSPIPHNSSSLLAANPTLTYYVPETQTILYINYFPHFQIPRLDLKTAINTIRTRMANHIAEEGDGWLLEMDDPIIETVSDGVEGEEWDIIIQSSPVTVHLSYGVVLDVMDGWESLINGQMGPCQIFASIQNAKRGQIGRLRIFKPRDVVRTKDLLMV